jgi:D-alanyl-lipoteichoic acid acyltransferase DltB (MBOAT superfamily)
VNYNQFGFWLFFAVILALYHRLRHKQQNTLLLVASYLFYGFWDYRFLFLILISTAIDFIGGLGVAGVRLPRRRLWSLAGLIVGSALLLCANVRYDALWGALLKEDGAGALAALPHHLADFRVPIVTVVLIAVYAVLLQRLYRAPEVERRRRFLAVSMVANLGILGLFKYCDFFVSSFFDLMTALGVPHGHAPILGVILPAGISFYTFQAMSYTIDIYRKETEPTDDFKDFAVFVCFFPHLIAGPIMRAHTLLPQVLKERALKAGDVEEGLALILIGLFKKIVIADNMAPIANAVFYRLSGRLHGSGEGLPTGLETLIGVYAFAFQIYGDFSGYSAIARGISKWLGFELVINFDLPYLAVSPSDFWRRWHISLSSWLRDYLYIPLGGNRGGVRKEYRNLSITMLLGGLWHGASWTFIAWGLYHGAILCVFRILKIPDRKPSDGWRYVARLIFMFHLTCLGWLLFRADDFSSVLTALRLIATDLHVTAAATTALCLIGFHAGVLCAAESLTGGERRLRRFIDSPWAIQGGVYAYLVGMMVMFRSGKAFAFIYFQF